MAYNRDEARERATNWIVSAMAIGAGQMTEIVSPVPDAAEGFALAADIQARIHQPFDAMPATSGHHYQITVSWTRRNGFFVVLIVGRFADGKGSGVAFPGNN